MLEISKTMDRDTGGDSYLTDYHLGYGSGFVKFTLAPEVSADTIIYTHAESSESPSSMIHDLLNNPIGAPPLREAAAGKTDAVILISDMTRLCPSWEFLPLLLNELNAAGLPDDRIQIIVALGAHRKQTESELTQLVGEEVYRRVSVQNHSARTEDCRFVGTTPQGTPVEINRDVVQADFRIVTGNVEPHRLAGMSGGVKALFPGVASIRSIEANHSLSARHSPSPGQLDQPIRRDMEEAAAFVPIHYLLNVVVDHDRRIIGGAAGDVIQAHRAAVESARLRFLVPVPELYDVVIVSTGGYPKDIQLYQAVKSLQNAASITRPGGSIVFIARCQELFGNGVFQYWVETIQDRQVIEEQLQRRFVLGAHKISHISKVIHQHAVYLYSDAPPPIVELIGFTPIEHLQQAVDRLTSPPGFKTAVMPYGSLTFPIQENH